MVAAVSINTFTKFSKHCQPLFHLNNKKIQKQLVLLIVSPQSHQTINIAVCPFMSYQ